MGRLKQLADSTEEEVNSYLNHLEWDSNPFTRGATVDDYVLPSEGEVADVISHINQYTGPILIHSQFSGIGKTTLVQVLMEDLNDRYQTIYVGEHNVTPFELVAIVADKSGVGKSSSTKMTEDKLANADFDRPLLIAVDEFGLNDPDTLHTIQFLNDELDSRVLLTGMSSQWNAVEGLGSQGKAFQRRVALEFELTDFPFEKTEELVKRRITTVTDVSHDEWETVDYTSFITEDALEYVHEQSHGVAGVVTCSLADAISLVAYQYAHGSMSTVNLQIAEQLNYSDPYAD